QLLYKINGVRLPRFLENQIKQGETIPQNEAEIGDLFFFRNKKNKLHVGIYVGYDEVIHCYDYVRINKIEKDRLLLNDNTGYNLDIVEIRKIIV
ncbi:MAG: NlpC/P60 family protein, partial [Bacteroidales bacterium]